MPFNLLESNAIKAIGGASRLSETQRRALAPPSVPQLQTLGTVGGVPIQTSAPFPTVQPAILPAPSGSPVAAPSPAPAPAPAPEPAPLIAPFNPDLMVQPTNAPDGSNIPDTPEEVARSFLGDISRLPTPAPGQIITLPYRPQQLAQFLQKAPSTDPRMNPQPGRGFKLYPIKQGLDIWDYSRQSEI